MLLTLKTCYIYVKVNSSAVKNSA